MTVDLSGDEIGLIQESLFMKIANLKQFERHCENQQEVQECEKLLVKTYKWQRDFRTKRGSKTMKFNVKDVKSWANRHDVKIGEKGYFINNLGSFKEDRADNSEFKIDRIKGIRDDFANCFISVNLFCLQDCFPFFLPLKAVKKEKKYRHFKSMRELTEIVYSKDWEYDNLSVGDSLWIRRKGDKHIHQNLLITSLGYDENDLISMNGKSMQEWLDNFEFLAHREWKPFGVEVK